MALKRDGSLWAWGNNTQGQLGNGTNICTTYFVQEITRATDWIKVAAGATHTVALKKDGTVWTWGGNWAGQLGYGTTISRNYPARVYCYRTTGSYTSEIIPGLTEIARKWGVLNYTINTPDGTSLTVDVLDESGTTTLLTNVRNGIDLSNNIDAKVYPRIRLRANFTTNRNRTRTPTLSDWEVTWEATTAK